MLIFVVQTSINSLVYLQGLELFIPYNRSKVQAID